jgi:outer membrane protein TolC
MLVLLVAFCASWQPGCRTGKRPGLTSVTAVSTTTGSPSKSARKSAQKSPQKSTQANPQDADINLVSYQKRQQQDPLGGETAPDSPEPTPPNQFPTNQSPPTPNPASQVVADVDGATPITLNRILDSVTDFYPEIEIAIGEIEAADGKVLSSLGRFDSVFAADSISQPLSFYKNYRNGVGVAQPLFRGGEVYGTYRIGRGKFEPWYGERATDEGGEFKAGFALPLLKDRAIDARRTALRSAEANRDLVSADVESRLLLFQRLATQFYWDWVASGRAVQTQQKLLDLARQRVKQINERVEKGDLATIAQIDNDRFIAKRQNDLIKAQRFLEKAAIKLSLFYRDQNGSPIIAKSNQLPNNFPQTQRITDDQRNSDITTAITVRPELLALAAARRLASVELQYANNLTLPKLDVKGFASKDIGPLASPLGDKRPFELNVGLIAEVPIQRREALGKIQTAQAKLSQLDGKIRLTTDKIRAELQDATSAVNAAYDQIEQSQKNAELARRSLELGRKAFDAGDIGLIELNIYETAVADAELQLLEAFFKYFFSRANYEAAKSGIAFEP